MFCELAILSYDDCHMTKVLYDIIKSFVNLAPDLLYPFFSSSLAFVHIYIGIAVHRLVTSIRCFIVLYIYTTVYFYHFYL